MDLTTDVSFIMQFLQFITVKSRLKRQKTNENEIRCGVNWRRSEARWKSNNNIISYDRKRYLSISLFRTNERHRMDVWRNSKKSNALYFITIFLSGLI